MLVLFEALLLLAASIVILLFVIERNVLLNSVLSQRTQLYFFLAIPIIVHKSGALWEV